MDHPILYGQHASHLWENQSPFQVLFHYLQICGIFFFGINKRIINKKSEYKMDIRNMGHKIFIQRYIIKINTITPSYHTLLTKYLRNVS